MKVRTVGKVIGEVVCGGDRFKMFTNELEITYGRGEVHAVGLIDLAAEIKKWALQKEPAHGEQVFTKGVFFESALPGNRGPRTGQTKVHQDKRVTAARESVAMLNERRRFQESQGYRITAKGKHFFTGDGQRWIGRKQIGKELAKLEGRSKPYSGDVISLMMKPMEASRIAAGMEPWRTLVTPKGMLAFLWNERVVSDLFDAHNPVKRGIKGVRFTDLKIPAASNSAPQQPSKVKRGGKAVVIKDKDWYGVKEIGVLISKALGKLVALDSSTVRSCIERYATTPGTPNFQTIIGNYHQTLYPSTLVPNLVREYKEYLKITSESRSAWLSAKMAPATPKHVNTDQRELVS